MSLSRSRMFDLHYKSSQNCSVFPNVNPILSVQRVASKLSLEKCAKAKEADENHIMSEIAPVVVIVIELYFSRGKGSKHFQVFAVQS